MESLPVQLQIVLIWWLCLVKNSSSFVPLDRGVSPHFEAVKANPSRLTNLHIGGLFPITGTGGWQGGQGCLPAARMALNDVNAEPHLMQGYRLVLHWNDSQVRSS